MEQHEPHYLNQLGNLQYKAAALAIVATLAAVEFPDNVAAATPDKTKVSLETKAQSAMYAQHSSLGYIAAAATKEKDKNKASRPKRVPSIDGKREFGVAVSKRFATTSYREHVEKNFDAIVPENELKMVEVMPRTGWNLDYSDFDYLLSLWKKPVRGHALVFGSENGKHDPPRIKSLGEACRHNFLGSKKRASRELTNTTREYIHLSMFRYSERIKQWDVFNEPLAEDGSYKETVWNTCEGPSHVESAFRMARDADRSAILFINEINVEFRGPKRDAFVALVKDLKEKGLVDGVGLQAHLSIYDAERIHELEETIKIFAAMGLRVVITEMDVAMDKKTPDEVKKQHIIYIKATKICLRQRVCTGMYFWGANDKVSWKTNDLPTLFHTDNKPKPAYKFIRKYLK